VKKKRQKNREQKVREERNRRSCGKKLDDN